MAVETVDVTFDMRADDGAMKVYIYPGDNASLLTMGEKMVNTVGRSWCAKHWEAREILTSCFVAVTIPHGDEVVESIIHMPACAQAILEQRLSSGRFSAEVVEALTSLSMPTPCRKDQI